MFSVRVASSTGVEAEFSVESATLALDVALRSQRAGLLWSAASLSSDATQPLSLHDLRRIATSRAGSVAEREMLDQVEWQHELQNFLALS